jgi:hypothetical protein
VSNAEKRAISFLSYGSADGDGRNVAKAVGGGATGGVVFSRSLVFYLSTAWALHASDIPTRGKYTLLRLFPASDIFLKHFIIFLCRPKLH